MPRRTKKRSHVLSRRTEAANQAAVKLMMGKRLETP